MDEWWPCWRVYWRGRGCPYRVLLALVDAPDRAAALAWAWREYGGFEAGRLAVERAEG